MFFTPDPEIVQPDSVNNDNDVDNTVSLFVLELVFAYSKACIVCKNASQMVYNNMPVIRWLTCGIIALYHMWDSFLRTHMFPHLTQNGCVEPSNNWVCTVQLRVERNEEDERYVLNETYDYQNDGTLPDEAETYEKYVHTAMEALYSKLPNPVKQTDRDDVLLWARNLQRDEQIVRLCSHDISCSDFPTDFTYSSVGFMCIEYRHPRLSGSFIEITLPKSLLIVGNQLFSPAFVFRWLKYQYGRPFPFDNEYELVIIDDSANPFMLRYGDYVKLDKTKMSIYRAKRNLPSICNSPVSSRHNSICEDSADNQDETNEGKANEPTSSSTETVEPEVDEKEDSFVKVNSVENE